MHAARALAPARPADEFELVYIGSAGDRQRDYRQLRQVRTVLGCFTNGALSTTTANSSTAWAWTTSKAAPGAAGTATSPYSSPPRHSSPSGGLTQEFPHRPNPLPGPRRSSGPGSGAGPVPAPPADDPCPTAGATADGAEPNEALLVLAKRSTMTRQDRLGGVIHVSPYRLACTDAVSGHTTLLSSGRAGGSVLSWCRQ